MAWAIEFHSDFALEFEFFSDNVKVEVLALAEILREEGPELNRPHADTLKGSRHSNMKELRCRGACKTWRVAFAFTPTRVALLLAAGDKSGTKEKRFYKSLIKKADARFDQFLTETTNSETAANERK